MNNILQANWRAPKHVKTLITQKNTNSTNILAADSFGFNIGAYVGDELSEVMARRMLLEEKGGLPGQPSWIKQVRGSKVLCLDDQYLNDSQEADASFSFEENKVCVVTSADCLPILLSDKKGQFVAAVHSGWQGLHENIIHNAVESIQDKAKDLGINLSEIIAYIGPSISTKNYQVGQDFYQRFVDQNKEYSHAFHEDEEGKYLADLKAIARLQLKAENIHLISESGICTYQSEDFYSHRQASHKGEKNTGRFATMIWLAE